MKKVGNSLFLTNAEVGRLLKLKGVTVGRYGIFSQYSPSSAKKFAKRLK